MRKAFVAMLCMILLSGCQGAKSDLPDRILKELNELTTQEFQGGTNRFKRRYAYYLPQGMGQRDSSELSEVLIKDGYRLIMNFDPGAIVIKEYYAQQNGEEDSSDETNDKNDLREDQDALGSQGTAEGHEHKEGEEQSDEGMASGQYNSTPDVITMENDGNRTVYRGSFRSEDEIEWPFTLQLIQGADAYLVYLNAAYVKLYTIVPSVQLSPMIKAMFTLTYSVRYDKDAILKAYSLKSLTQTKKEALDYLEQHLPSSGSLQELLESENVDAEKDDNAQ